MLRGGKKWFGAEKNEWEREIEKTGHADFSPFLLNFHYFLSII